MALDEEQLEAILSRFLADEPLEALLTDLPLEERVEAEETLRLLARIRQAERPALSAAAVARHERMLMQHAAGPGAGLSARPAPPENAGWLRWLPWRLGAVPAAVAAAITIVVLMLGGTLSAAASSLPSSPLYSVKLATEQLQLALAFNDETRARVHLALAEHRLAEAERLAQSEGAGSPDELERLLLSAQESIAQAVAIAQQMRGPSAIALLTDLSGVVTWERTLLEGLLPAVPPPRQPTIEQAISTARANQAEVQQVLQERVSETITAPGTPPETEAPAPVGSATPEPAPPTATTEQAGLGAASRAAGLIPQAPEAVEHVGAAPPALAAASAATAAPQRPQPAEPGAHPTSSPRKTPRGKRHPAPTQAPAANTGPGSPAASPGQGREGSPAGKDKDNPWDNGHAGGPDARPPDADGQHARPAAEDLSAGARSGPPYWIVPTPTVEPPAGSGDRASRSAGAGTKAGQGEKSKPGLGPNMDSGAKKAGLSPPDGPDRKASGHH